MPPGYGFRVLEPGATWSVSWWRRALMAAVTVGLTWMCASFVVGSATMLHPADMEPMPASMDLAVGDVEQVASAVGERKPRGHLVSGRPAHRRDG